MTAFDGLTGCRHSAKTADARVICSSQYSDNLAVNIPVGEKLIPVTGKKRL